MNFFHTFAADYSQFYRTNSRHNLIHFSPTQFFSNNIEPRTQKFAQKSLWWIFTQPNFICTVILRCLTHKKRLNPQYERCSSTCTPTLLSLSFDGDDKRKQWSKQRVTYEKKRVATEYSYAIISPSLFTQIFISNFGAYLNFSSLPLVSLNLHANLISKNFFRIMQYGENILVNTRELFVSVKWFYCYEVFERFANDLADYSAWLLVLITECQLNWCRSLYFEFDVIAIDKRFSARY